MGFQIKKGFYVLFRTKTIMQSIGAHPIFGAIFSDGLNLWGLRGCSEKIMRAKAERSSQARMLGKETLLLLRPRRQA